MVAVDVDTHAPPMNSREWFRSPGSPATRRRGHGTLSAVRHITDHSDCVMQPSVPAIRWITRPPRTPVRCRLTVLSGRRRKERAVGSKIPLTFRGGRRNIFSGDLRESARFGARVTGPGRRIPEKGGCHDRSGERSVPTASIAPGQTPPLGSGGSGGRARRRGHRGVRGRRPPPADAALSTVGGSCGFPPPAPAGRRVPSGRSGSFPAYPADPHQVCSVTVTGSADLTPVVGPAFTNVAGNGGSASFTIQFTGAAHPPDVPQGAHAPVPDVVLRRRQPDVVLGEDGST